MKILITGIAGHFGSEFARWVLANRPGVRIVGVDNLSSGFRENVPEGVEWLKDDLADGPLPPALFQVDYVFHFAAFAAECLSPFVRSYTVRNVWLATTNVITACINAGCIKRLVFTSSAAVYGNIPAPHRETDICRPNDPYGIAKLACEHDLRCAREQFGLDYCILRPHNVFGPGQSIWNEHRNVIGIWMRAALEGRPLRIYGDGNQTRQFTPGPNLWPSLWEAAMRPEASQEILNVGESKSISIATLAEMVHDITGACGIVYELARHEMAHVACDNTRSEVVLGYRGIVSTEQYIRDMWEWAHSIRHSRRLGDDNARGRHGDLRKYHGVLAR